jgi:hypothetical protein
MDTAAARPEPIPDLAAAEHGPAEAAVSMAAEWAEASTAVVAVSTAVVAVSTAAAVTDK